MAEQYADIIIDISHEKVDRVFQYRIPEALAGEVTVGAQVDIPLRTGQFPAKRLCGGTDGDALIPGGKAQGDFRRPEGGGVGSVPAH